MKLATMILCGCIAMSNLVCPVAATKANASETFYADTSFQGGSFQGNVEENIYYHHKVETDYHIQYSMPHYVDISDGVNTNSCASTAGGIVMGYYDRVYDELIPGFTAGRTIRGVYIYYSTTAVVQEQALDPLYAAMKTNVYGPGTTAQDCRNGLKSVVEQRGRSCAYTSVVSNKNLTVSKYKTAIDNEHPVLIFAQGYNLTPQVELEKAEGHDYLLKNYYTGAHVFAAYGYKKIDYYNANGDMIDTRTLLYVSSGIDDVAKCYMILNEGTGLLEGYEVTIG